MNTCLICEICGENLNIKHLQYYLYLKQKTIYNKSYKMSDIMESTLKVNDECCKKQVMSKKMNKNMHIFLMENIIQARRIFKIKNL